MKKYIIPFFLLMLLGCLGSKPNLSVSLSKISPAQPYEGDALKFDVNVVNSGGAEAREFTLELLVNNVSVKTEAVSLAPGSNRTISASWFPLDAGVYDVVARADAGNVVSEPSPEKESRMQVTVIPSEQVDVFAEVPDKKFVEIALSELGAEGLSAAYSQASELPPYLSLLSPSINFLKNRARNLKELRIGTVGYNDSSTAVVIFIRGAVSPEQIAESVGVSTERKVINGREVVILTSESPLCALREGGWLKLLAYQTVFSGATCEDVIGLHNSSNANELLSMSDELVSALPFNATPLGTTKRSNMTRAEYGAAFEDEEGFYEFHVIREPYTPQNSTCFARITNRSRMQSCEEVYDNSTWTFVQRKVGNYSLTCISIPKAGERTIPIEMKALDMCYAFNFSGEERTWLRPIDMLNPKKCEFPDNFTCLSYEFINSTLMLNLTQNTGRGVVVHGLKCSAEESTPTGYFQLRKPVELEHNSSVKFEIPCYDKFGSVKEGDLVYFNSKMYLNYSFEGSNETKVIVGNLTIRKI